MSSLRATAPPSSIVVRTRRGRPGSGGIRTHPRAHRHRRDRRPASSSAARSATSSASSAARCESSRTVAAPTERVDPAARPVTGRAACDSRPTARRAHLATNLAARTISCQFLLMVLALWYSRAGSWAVLQWCHLSHAVSGRSQLEALESAGPARRGLPGGRRLRRHRPAARAASGRPTRPRPTPPTELPTVIATRGHPARRRRSTRTRSTTEDARRLDASAAGRLQGPLAGHRQDRPPAGHDRRADHVGDVRDDGAGQSTDRHVPAGPARDRGPGRPGHGVGTVIKTGDYVDMVVGFTADKFPVVTRQPDRRLDHGRGRPQRDERQAAPPGHAGARHAAAAAAADTATHADGHADRRGGADHRSPASRRS